MKSLYSILLLLISFRSFSTTPEKIIENMGIKLSSPSSTIGNYIHFTKSGNILYLTGKGPSLPSGGYMKGKIGKDLSLTEGQKAAELTIIHQLGVLKTALKKLGNITKILRMNVMVNSTDTFTAHPQIADGASNLLTKVFGDKVGKHSRVVWGVNSLPMNIPVEIDLIVEIKAE